MQPSMFNLRVPLPAHDEVFLMNTLSDAQLLVSPDVAALLDSVADAGSGVDRMDPKRRTELSRIADPPCYCKPVLN